MVGSNDRLCVVVSTVFHMFLNTLNFFLRKTIGRRKTAGKLRKKCATSEKQLLF